MLSFDCTELLNGNILRTVLILYYAPLFEKYLLKYSTTVFFSYCVIDKMSEL